MKWSEKWMNNLDQIQVPAFESAEPDRVLPLLQVISDLIEKRCDKFLNAKYGLTMPQYQLLLAAIHESDMTLGGLSEQLNCSRGNVTGIVDRLERDGWLERERSTVDRRVITVRLTEKGATVQAISRELTEEMSKLAGIWEASERSRLTQILLRIYRELKD